MYGVTGVPATLEPLCATLGLLSVQLLCRTAYVAGGTSREGRWWLTTRWLFQMSSPSRSDEWGPWLEKWVEHNNAQTGRAELVKVLRTDPAGVRLMKKYTHPSVLTPE